MGFSQQLGGAIFASAGQNVFANDLKKGLSSIPGVDAGSILNIGITELAKSVPATQLHEVILKYSHALTRAFLMATIIGPLALLGAFTMEWVNIKKKDQMGPPGPAPATKPKTEV
jgi:hypothetical protein